MTAPTAQAFRKDLPEFADTTRYPNAVLDYWLGIGAQIVNAQRFGDLTNPQIESFAAHNITLERRAIDEAERGGQVGMGVGILTSKSVDKASASYDVSTGAETGAGFYNQTIYGKRYWQMLRLHGAGGIQVGVGFPPGPLSSFNAWAGPWFANVPNPSDSG